MKVELRPLAEVKPYEKNPRLNDGAVEAVARSIQEFGFRQPIVVDRDMVIVLGHTRWKAAKQLGLEQVPVHVATELTPEQAKAYRIADNATAALATWNLELLPAELGGGLTHHQGFDLARGGSKAKRTTTKLGAKDRPLANDFVSDEEFSRMLGNIARVLAPGQDSICGAAMPTAPIIRRSSRPAAYTSARASSG